MKTRWSFLIVLVCLGGISYFLLFPRYSCRLIESPQHSQAKNDVTLIVSAMQAYQTEYGFFPSGNAVEVIDVLQGRNSHGKNARQLVFLELSSKQLSKSGAFLDWWGCPYVFGVNSARHAWAYSFGKNGIDEGGHGDDLSSWN